MYAFSQLGTTPLVATAPMPDCSMKIYVGDSEQEVVAENVKIGDPLTLVINIDLQGKGSAYPTTMQLFSLDIFSARVTQVPT